MKVNKLPPGGSQATPNITWATFNGTQIIPIPLKDKDKNLHDTVKAIAAADVAATKVGSR